LKQRRRGHHLHCRVEQRIQQGRNDHQEAHGFAVEIVGVHVAGGDEPVALAEQPLALGEEGAADGDRQHVKRREGVGDAVAPDQAGVADEGPARKRCGRGGHEKGEKGHRAPADGIAGRSFFRKKSLHAFPETVGHVNAEHDVYPGDSAHG
jgi:hypothetical protein